jgi:hypothetical protein
MGDQETKAKIMLEKDPRKQQGLGRYVDHRRE